MKSPLLRVFNLQPKSFLPSFWIMKSRTNQANYINFKLLFFMKKYVWFVLLLFIFSCKGEYSNEPVPENSRISGALNGFSNDAEYDIVPPPAASEVILEQKLIREAYLRFQTKNIDTTFQNITSYVKRNGGFIQNDRSDKSYNQLTRTLIVRIPVKNFNTVVNDIDKDVAYFDSKNISSRDVTEEFIDLEARLKAKRTLEERYLQILSKAKNVKEILDIERELSKIREEIEAKQGRLKYLENKVSMSTLTIEFYKITAETGVTISYGSKVWNALKSGFDGVSTFFLFLLNIWPFLIIVTILTYYIRKKWKKARSKKES